MFLPRVSGSRSAVSDSLRPHGLYSLWNSPGQNTGEGSLSLLQGIFLTQGSNPGLLHCKQIRYCLCHQSKDTFIIDKNHRYRRRSMHLPSHACALEGSPQGMTQVETRKRWIAFSRETLLYVCVLFTTFVSLKILSEVSVEKGKFLAQSLLSQFLNQDSNQKL